MPGRRDPEARASAQLPDPSDTAGNGVPDYVTDQARATFDRQAPGALAELVFDSLVDEGAPPTDHRLRFEHAALQVDVHVSAAAEGTTLDGTAKPSLQYLVELQFEGAEDSLVEEGPGGIFRFEQVPHGLVRLWLRGSTATPSFRTDWFRV
jgi:hypothetical protein